jgi:fluoride exporter
MELVIAMASVALLGGAGSALRHIAGFWSGYLPWGILVVNSVASFVAGVAVATGLFEIALVVGLAGGLSTFSTFAANTFEFIKAGQRVRALANTVLNLTIPALSLLTALIWL